MTQHPTEPGLIAQGGSETAGTDILVHLLNAGDVVGILHDLTAEVERLRGALKGLADGWRASGVLPNGVIETCIADVQAVLRGDQ